MYTHTFCGKMFMNSNILRLLVLFLLTEFLGQIFVWIRNQIKNDFTIAGKLPTWPTQIRNYTEILQIIYLFYVQ